MTGELSIVESAQLADLEPLSRRRSATFVEVGLALGAIRDRRLYRASHATFEDYCRERWGFVASRARQLIAAAETVTAVTVDGLPPPPNEAQARELCALRDDPKQLREAWASAIAAGKPTAERVRRAVDGRRPRRPGFQSPEEALAAYSQAAKSLAAVLAYAETFRPPGDLPDAHIPLREFVALAEKVAVAVSSWARPRSKPTPPIGRPPPGDRQAWLAAAMNDPTVWRKIRDFAAQVSPGDGEEVVGDLCSGCRSGQQGKGRWPSRSRISRRI